VKSSFGHVRDLPKGKMGVDTEHDFAPSYVIPTKARKTVTELKKLAAKSDAIYSRPTPTAKEKPFLGTWPKCWAKIRKSSSASLSTKLPRKRSSTRSKSAQTRPASR